MKKRRKLKYCRKIRNKKQLGNDTRNQSNITSVNINKHTRKYSKNNAQSEYSSSP